MNWIKRDKLTFLAILIMAFLSVLILSGNIKSAFNLCLHAIDFSTYQQAIYEIAAGDSWNPYISIRDLKIFNDHADPAVIIAALFLKITPISRYSLLVFEWLWFAGTVMIVFLLGGYRNKKSSLFAFALALLVFSRPLLMGLEFPIHPTTWSMLVGFLVSYFIVKGNFKGLILSLISICLFREIYAFMAIGLSGYYFINRKWKEAFSVLTIGIFFFLILIVFRPYFVGPVVDYGNSVMSEFLSGGLAYFVKKFRAIDIPWNIYVQYIPFLLVAFYFEFKRLGKRIYSSSLAGILFFIIPGIVIHIVVGRIAHHQAIPMVSPVLGYLVFSEFGEKFLSLKKWMIWPCLILIIATSSSRYTKSVSLLFFNKASGTCKFDEEKRENANELLDVFASIDSSKVILASGTIIPALMKPGLHIYQISDSIRIQPKYDYLIFEKPGTGNTYPLSDADTKALLDRCGPFAEEKMVDNKHYVLWKGNFSDVCTMQSSYWPNMDGSLIPKEK